MRSETAIFNLSGIYEHESFYLKDKSSRFVDLSDISGTNCYCDDEAAKEILSRAGNTARGIHFIDSGNYHYMSALFLRLVREPFSLVVLDHHPDMQRPMFDILSCGGWVLDVLERSAFVRDVHIIGADRILIDELEESVRQRAFFYDVADVTGADGSVRLPDTKHPVYLSVDKDVISEDELATNWDQGEASGDFVISFANKMLSCREVIAVDICGECSADQDGINLEKEIQVNDRFNCAVLSALMNCGT